MVQNKNGSALLLVLTSTAILLILATTFWQNSSLILDLVLIREQYYKNLSITQTALDWTTKIVADNFDLFLKQENLAKLPIELDFSFLAQEPEEKNVYVTVDVAKENENSKNIFCLAANFCDKEKTLCSISCLFMCDENLVDEQKDKNCGFRVKHYTIRNFV